MQTNDNKKKSATQFANYLAEFGKHSDNLFENSLAYFPQIECTVT